MGVNDLPKMDLGDFRQRKGLSNKLENRNID